MSNDAPVEKSQTKIPQAVANGSPPDGGPCADGIVQGESPALVPTPTSTGLPLIPDHELLQRIGGGSYGEVWLAKNAVGTLRAIKIVHRQTFERAEHFEREFKGLQKFEPLSRTHDGFVDILQLGRNDEAGYFYYVMELADGAKPRSSNQCSVISDQSSESAALLSSGGSLNTDYRSPITSYSPHTLRHDLKQHGRLPVAQCVQIGLALAEALDHLHEHKLVHRDIKPSNIIFVKGQPKLADIGLVTSIDEAHSLVGTVGYIPPEGPGTSQADIYSLGKVLYEAAFGKDRQEFPQLPADLQSHPDHIRLLELNEVITKACEADPKRRYQSAAELRGELEALQMGKSVKHQRSLQHGWAVFKKFALAAIFLAAFAGSVFVLQPRLTRSEISYDGPPSKIDDANTLCDRALKAIRSDNYERFPQAYSNLNQAIKFDPNFARPYVGLLEIRLREAVPSLGPMRPDELHTIATRLKALAPRLPATYCAQALVIYEAFDYPKARELLLQAVKAGPDYELAHTVYGGILLRWGWPKEAREQLLISQRLAPSKMHVFFFLGYTCFQERDYTNAIAWHRKALDVEPRYAGAYQGIGEAYEAMGDYIRAVENYETWALLRGENAVGVKQRYSDLRRALDEGGVPGYWLEWWRREQKRPNVNFYWKAVVQMHLGNTNAALDLLDKSYDAREGLSAEGGLSTLFCQRCWDGLQDNPGFKKLLDKATFSKVMPPRK